VTVLRRAPRDRGRTGAPHCNLYTRHACHTNPSHAMALVPMLRVNHSRARALVHSRAPAVVDHSQAPAMLL